MKYLYNLNSLLDSKILEWSKFKAIADNFINLHEKLKLGLGRIENLLFQGR